MLKMPNANLTTPTAAGKALPADAEGIEAELRHARNDVHTVHDAQVGEIRVSASPTVAVGLLPRTVVAFQRARPHRKPELMCRDEPACAHLY